MLELRFPHQLHIFFIFRTDKQHRRNSCVKQSSHISKNQGQNEMPSCHCLALLQIEPRGLTSWSAGKMPHSGPDSDKHHLGKTVLCRRQSPCEVSWVCTLREMRAGNEQWGEGDAARSPRAFQWEVSRQGVPGWAPSTPAQPLNTGII